MRKEEKQQYVYTRENLRLLFKMNIEKFPLKVKKGLVDVEFNHDTSWVKDVYLKNKNNLDDIALFFRGTKISYRELFINASKYANSFAKLGIKEKTEVPIYMSNSPEFIYVIMGLNLLGAKANVFGEFDKDYIKEIIEDCDSEYLVCTSDKYEYIKDLNSKKVIMFDLANSLKHNPYEEIDICDFTKKTNYYKNENILDIDDFLVDDYKDIEEYNVGDLATEFLVTYSSGSTNSSRPKAIIHCNRSLITMGRFQDRDLSSLPPTKGLIGEMIIPNHSNTSIITSMSDVLYKGCTVAIEPVYDRDFLLNSLAINKPNFIAVPRQMLVHALKMMYKNPFYQNFKMPYMMMLTSVGEPTSKGEEKFINKMLKKANCGCDKLPKPLSPVTVSIGGGDCERGGMFFTPYRALQDLNPKYKLIKGRCGLKKYAMVQVKVVDKDGKELKPNQVGYLLAKTPTMMKGYKNNPQANKAFYTKDSNGETWSFCNVYAKIDNFQTIEILERIGKEIKLEDGTLYPLYKIGMEVEKDTKHILSYEVVNIDNEIVIHVEFQPDAHNNPTKVLSSIQARILKYCGEEIANKVMYRIRTFEEGFKGTHCEKRDYNALVDEGITEKCVKGVDGEIKPVLKQKTLVLK